MIEIKRYVSGLLSSNMYVVREGEHAIVIDPFDDTTPSEGLIIDYIILTHEHYDHISGVNVWKEMTGAPVLCSKACAENIQNPKKNLSNHFKEFCELQTWIELDEIPSSDPNYTCSADQIFEAEENILWQGHSIQLFEIPGHSLGSIGVIIDSSHFFSGDSLMENCEIELRMPGGSRKKWKEIGAPRLTLIPDGVLVYPGHFQEFIYMRKGETKIGGFSIQ